MPPVLFFYEILLHTVRKKSPFHYRLHSAVGPQAPAELTVAIATTMDNYPAKDWYSRQSEQHLVFMLKMCCPLHCRVTFQFLFFPLRCGFHQEHVDHVFAISHHDDSCRRIINITYVAVGTCLKVWQLRGQTRESPHCHYFLQGLTCQQTVTPQVATCKYGL